MDSYKNNKRLPKRIKAVNINSYNWSCGAVAMLLAVIVGVLYVASN